MKAGPDEVQAESGVPGALHFLNAVHEGAEGLVEFRYIREEKVRQSFHRLPLENLPALPSDTHDCYFGVAPRSRQSGKADAIEATKSLWLDVDAKAFQGGKEEARAKLEALGPLQPSIVVDSGHGYHAYWLLERPLPIAEAQQLMHFLRGAVNPRLDDVADAARILRVPGTWNHKRWQKLPVCIEMWRPERRFSSEELDRLRRRPGAAAPEGQGKARAKPVEKTETAEHIEKAQSIAPPTQDSLCSLSPSARRAVRQAIEDTIPSEPGCRNRMLFRFVRTLKSIPEVAGLGLAALVPFVRQWHRRAVPHIGSKHFGDTLADFNRGWGKVHTPLDEGLLTRLLDRARAAATPRSVASLGPKIELLAKLCVELQRHNGAGTFFLAQRSAASLLGGSGNTAGDYLKVLVGLGFLELVEQGGPPNRASRYRVSEAALQEAGVECEPERET